MISEISVTDLSRRIAEPDAPVVLDVLEPQEIALARFPGAR